MKHALLLGIFLLISACSPDSVTLTKPPKTNTPVPKPTRAPGPWRIMPLGDSLTEGAYPLGFHSYRGYLEIQLREAGYNFDFDGTQWGLAHGGTDYEHEGHGGFTIGPDDTVSSGWPGNIYARLDYYLKTDPDIILLLISKDFSYSSKLSRHLPIRNNADIAFGSLWRYSLTFSKFFSASSNRFSLK